MTQENVDRRVLNILRWSLIIQIFFLVQSSSAPSFLYRLRGLRPEPNLVSAIPLALMVLVFILLSFKGIQEKITKPVFLAILYILALTTIFSRYIFSNMVAKGPRNLQPFINFRWDMVFYLIIPLVFIAWQYSMREVLFYCFLIIAAEAVPLFFPDPDRDLFFIITNILGDIARSVILVIVGWIENQLVALQRDQHNQLKKANKKLRKFALANEKLAQTQERNRLARELHDTLAHTLSSVSVQLEATKALFDRSPKEAKKMLDETIKNTKNGLTDTRRTLVDLRSSELESYGLTQAIRNMGKSAAERGGFKVKFHLDNGIDVLSDEIGHCLFRTAQEAVENTLRHANAKILSITLLFDDDKVKMQVKDDGKGFNMQELNDEHLGIRGMRERVEMLEGTFKVESSPENGTIINVVLKRDND